MVSKAIARYVRISPRKTRLVANYVKDKSVGEALSILSNLNKRASELIEDVLRSAISNAKRDPAINEGDLYISKLTVDNGPMLKRFKAGSMGRAMMIRHRTSHISVELNAKIKPKAKTEKTQKLSLRGPRTTKVRGKLRDRSNPKKEIASPPSAARNDKLRRK